MRRESSASVGRCNSYSVAPGGGAEGGLTPGERKVEGEEEEEAEAEAGVGSKWEVRRRKSSKEVVAKLMKRYSSAAPTGGEDSTVEL